MAIMPLAGRQFLTKLTIDLGMRLPVFRQETDMRGLTTVMVTVYVNHANIPAVDRTFASMPEYNCIIAEDIASRLALRFIQSYYAGDNRISAYLNTHVFAQTKQAWQAIANSLGHQLDLARDLIRHLHDQLYQTRLNYTSYSERMNHTHLLETLKTNSHLRELSDETARQRSQIILLKNRVHYLENMNTLLCVNHRSLLQLPRPREISTSGSSIQATIHGSTTQNVSPLAAGRANLTEL